MLLLAAAAIAAAPQPPMAVRQAHSTALCQRAQADVASAESRYDGKPLAPRKLTELPPANMYVAVLRQDANGCLDPIIVRYNVGR